MSNEFEGVDLDDLEPLSEKEQAILIKKVKKWESRIEKAQGYLQVYKEVLKSDLGKKGIKSVDVPVDEELYRLTNIEAPTQVVWEEENIRPFLEERDLWDDVVEVRAVFNPERLGELVAAERITTEELATVATLKTKKGYLKLTVVKNLPPNIDAKVKEQKGISDTEDVDW